MRGTMRSLCARSGKNLGTGLDRTYLLSLRLLLRREQPLGIGVLLGLWRFSWRLFGRALGRWRRASACGISENLLVVARGAGRLVHNRLEAGGGPPLVELRADRGLAVAQPLQPLVADLLDLAAQGALVGVSERWHDPVKVDGDAADEYVDQE